MITFREDKIKTERVEFKLIDDNWIQQSRYVKIN